MQPSVEFIFVLLTRGNGHHDGVIFHFRYGWRQVVQLEEGKHCHARDTFVAVNKWMVLALLFSCA